MKIYNSPVAPNPRRVRIFLAEKDIKVPFEDIDIANAVNRQPEFRKKNPLAGVPVLELDDGTCIAESVAICRYFEEQKPEPPLSRSPIRFASATSSSKDASGSVRSMRTSSVRTPKTV
jgi:glutathione S-transferase